MTLFTYQTRPEQRKSIQTLRPIPHSYLYNTINQLPNCDHNWRSSAYALAEKGFSLIPLNERLYTPVDAIIYASNSAKLSHDEITLASREYPNIGVVTGNKSMNLFVVECNSEKSFEFMRKHLGNYACWISYFERKWSIWLLCVCGTVFNTVYRKDVVIKGCNSFVILPGSRSLDGEKSKWIAQDGPLPPIFDKDKMEGYFETVRYCKKTDQPIYVTYTPMPNQLSFPHQGLPTLDELWLFAEEYDFGKGRTGAGMQSLYFALLKRAKVESPTNFRATSRELAELAGITEKTARKYLKKLISLGFVEFFKKKSLGFHYSLVKPRNFYPINYCPINGVKLTHCAYRDIWTSFGFGKCGQKIIEILLPAEKRLSVIEISEAVSYSTITVRKRLSQMEQFGLVSKTSSGWAIVYAGLNEENLTKIEKSLGVNGSIAKKKKIHEKERKKFLRTRMLSNY